MEAVVEDWVAGGRRMEGRMGGGVMMGGGGRKSRGRRGLSSSSSSSSFSSSSSMEGGGMGVGAAVDAPSIESTTQLEELMQLMHKYVDEREFTKKDFTSFIVLKFSVRQFN
jgi:hypothetical protein